MYRKANNKKYMKSILRDMRLLHLWVFSKLRSSMSSSRPKELLLQVLVWTLNHHPLSSSLSKTSKWLIMLSPNNSNRSSPKTKKVPWNRVLYPKSFNGKIIHLGPHNSLDYQLFCVVWATSRLRKLPRASKNTSSKCETGTSPIPQTLQPAPIH